MRLIFLVCTCKTYSFSNIYIDRPDLTRKLSCLETWVPRVIEKGHEVIFYSGDNETEYYDEQHKHLYLTADDEYDYGHKPSIQHERLKSAIKWVLNNREFDYVYTITDSDYVNISLLTDKIKENISKWDFLSNGSGGEGFFLSKKVCDILVNDPYVNELPHSDNAIHHMFFHSEICEKYNLKVNGHACAEIYTKRAYILAEKNFLTHYCNGKRMYWADFVMSNYYNGTPIQRKIIYNLPFDAIEGQSVHTYETINKSNTPKYYSQTTDKNGWEHFGKHQRSDSFCDYHFGKNSIYRGLFIDYVLLPSYDSEINNVVLNLILPSIQKDGYIVFYYEKDEYNNYELLKNCLIENNINFTIDTNPLKYFNIEEELVQKSEYLFNNEFIKISNG